LAVAGGTDALAGSLGISGGGTLAVDKVVAAMVAEVNRTGGILGRQLALYVHSYDAAKALSNPSQVLAEVCADFRDDHEVFAVLSSVLDPALRQCLAEMGSPLLALGGGVSTIISAAAYQENGGSYLYGIDTISIERLSELFIQSLLARRFTEPWNTASGAPGGAPVKLGVIHVDAPDTTALYAAYGRELEKAGLRFEEKVTYPQNIDDAIASSLSAVLRFRSAGITHVFGASAFFLRVAESQGYRPRYAYLPALGAIGVANSPAPQMRGAMSVGWVPVTDVGGAQDPGDNPGATACRTTMQAAGLSLAARADVAVMYAACDAVGAFRAALTAGGSADVASLRRGYESLGSSFPTALAFGASLGPNRHNGVDSVRDLAFDAGCACLEYTSGSNRS
jgi:ABC-type branched-subunit amino acid transport system substrate-binding protein